MAVIDPNEYTIIPFNEYQTLQSKLQALLDGEVLFIKHFERNEGANVLVRIVQKKFTVAQITYDTTSSEVDSKYWVTFNVGVNDLSLFTCFQFTSNVFNKGNKFIINDTVLYTSKDGRKDTAIIEEVYAHNEDPTKFAYKLSRDEGLYAEDELIVHKMM
ncbi:hypothetical protein [Bacillus phage phiAGATE]|uniref:Uncharacterized protein n=1 Tax=Bacillus phage phiAGATE TaxID=1204533 RepID=L0LAD8_9CAUD|nr:virion structural protein [Bacillus phage phiAGATE]AGB62687.1 hypothetical protein [Bacillus phage phiAGATE]